MMIVFRLIVLVFLFAQALVGCERATELVLPKLQDRRVPQLSLGASRDVGRGVAAGGA